jgi:UDP-GlcNAc3NAcA epimerase
MKILTIVGARPQFIKAAAVSRAIEKWNSGGPECTIQEQIIHTGQHYDANMSDVFFKEMQIPKPFLNLQVGSGNHGRQTGLMLEKLEAVFLEEKPDVVLVYGDTNSTLAGALAAGKLHIPVAHVEAGLRSYNKQMPEEQNRVLTDHLSTFLFCPTQTALKNLEREGFSGQPVFQPSADSPAVVVCGDVMYDCVLFYGELAEGKSDILERLQLQSGQNTVTPFVLATIHRQENTDDPKRLAGIISALASINETLPVILPLHPRTLKLLNELSELKAKIQSIRVIEPVSYLDMILLEKNCTVVCTDSGGVQKEAFFFDKPCITMRDQTEWVETVDAGWNVVTGADAALIERCARTAQDWTKKRTTSAPFEQKQADETNLFGDGHSAELIVKEIVEKLG